MGEPGINQSVEKATAVLSALATGQPMRVTDVARAAGIGPSTTLRMLTTLEATGCVERDRGGLYQLGFTLITWAAAAVNAHPVHQVARQSAQQLAARLGLGVNVAVRRDDHLFYLCDFEGERAPRSFTLMGRTNPLHATGLGKALLSGLSPQERRELLPELPAYTDHTITDHEALDTAIERIHSDGVVSETEELALSRGCLAAPILDRRASVTAAISVSGPLSAIGRGVADPALREPLIETADMISSALGYGGPSQAFPQVASGVGA